jgi:hypothetical protein
MFLLVFIVDIAVVIIVTTVIDVLNKRAGADAINISGLLV